MRLIGMPDSPFVRRVAISMKIMGLPFKHEAVSVFRHYDTFAAINPVVKAPSLVLDDGTVLMDSTLILEYVERLVAPERRLTPSNPRDYARSQRIIGLALVAAEKTVQAYYEDSLRPAERKHQPWRDRVEQQYRTAYDLLEKEIDSTQEWIFGSQLSQADITTAVAWRFTQFVLKEPISADVYPALATLSERAEALPEFISTPLE
jgi:glutathione S-transferase